jgi:hypothetical protein
MRAMCWLLAACVLCGMVGCGGGGSEPDDVPGKTVTPPACAANPKACA